jgi:hypothetical protein
VKMMNRFLISELFPTFIACKRHFGTELGLGLMSGPLENAEKLNTEITQPLKKLPILMWLSSTSQARYRAFLKHL